MKHPEEAAMKSKNTKALQARTALRIRTVGKKEADVKVTTVRISEQVEVGTIDGWLCFWTAGHEVRIGPLTADQAEKLAEDLGYEAVAD
jgi:hypothetical protein